MLFAWKDGEEVNIKMIDWALNSNLKSTEKIVLISVAKFSDRRGFAHPTQEDLSKCSGLARVTVNKILVKLDEKRVLEKFKYVGGHNNIMEYRFCPVLGNLDG